MGYIPLIETCKKCQGGEDVECFFNGCNTVDVLLISGQTIKNVDMEECNFDRKENCVHMYYVFDTFPEEVGYRRGKACEYKRYIVCAKDIVCICKNMREFEK